jgi:hypothetical protein
MVPKRKIPTNLALLVAGFLGLTGFHGCFEDEEEAPSVKIVKPVKGSTVTGPNVLVQVKVVGFTLGVGEAGEGRAAMHGGHVHLFLDKPIGPDATRTALLDSKDTVTLTGVAPGSHYLWAEGVDEAHKPFPGAKDSITFIVQ